MDCLSKVITGHPRNGFWCLEMANYARNKIASKLRLMFVNNLATLHITQKNYHHIFRRERSLAFINQTRSYVHCTHTPTGTCVHMGKGKKTRKV